MPIQFTEKWDQYGLMAELALKLKGVSPQFGKTVLQKLVYIYKRFIGFLVGTIIYYTTSPYRRR